MDAELDRAKRQLRAVMLRIPFDFQTAGATRVVVWKKLHREAEKLLKRSPAQAFKYDDLRIRMEQCGQGAVESIVEGVFEKKEGLP